MGMRALGYAFLMDFLIDILLIIEYSHIGFRMEKFRGVGTV